VEGKVLVLLLLRSNNKSQQMCNKIVEWNARTYSATMANCQCFVNEVLEAMEIKLQMGGALGILSPPPFSKNLNSRLIIP